MDFFKTSFLKTFSITSLILFTQFSTVKSQEIDSTYSVNFLSKLISIQAYSQWEKPVYDHLADWCKSQDLYFEDLSLGDTILNFITMLEPPSEKPLILLSAHMDVVWADEYGWKYPPFSGAIAEGFIWGRGAIDDKGPLSMQLLALARYHRLHPMHEIPFNVGVLAVSSEEIGGYGADYVMKNHLNRFNPVVIFGEGGSGLKNIIPSKPNTPIFGISVTEKIPLWLLLEAKVKSNGHSSNADLYASKNLLRALIKVADEPKKIRFHHVTKKMLKDLGELEGGLKGFVLKRSSSWFFWPFTKKLFNEGGAFSSLVSDTYTITEINTIKGNINSVPQQASAYVDCRLLPGTSIKMFLLKLRLKVGNKVVITPIYTGYDAKPSEVDDYFHAMGNAIKSIYPSSEVKPFLFPASSDNNTFRFGGFSTFGITPIIVDEELMATVHNINERVPIDSYLLGIDTYYKFIEDLIYFNKNVEAKR